MTLGYTALSHEAVFLRVSLIIFDRASFQIPAIIQRQMTSLATSAARKRLQTGGSS
jgi:hypothetical protein